MSGASISLRPADGDALSYVESVLERNDLPAGDVRSTPGQFYVAFDGDSRVGVGGIEQCGADGLLRSVAVEKSVRGTGVGTELCEALEREARDAGVERLYLLTTTAAGFFADRGYEGIDREDAPEAIQGTTEFDDLCPTTATCMKKSLQ